MASQRGVGGRAMVIYAWDGLRERRQAQGLLRAAAAAHWKLEPLPEIARGRWGKPYFPQAEARCFNLSHSGRYALCGLDDLPLGVDIQVVTPRRESLVERSCSPRERAWLRAGGDRPEDFILLWALKESRVKESGRGIVLPLSQVSVPLPPLGAISARMEWEGLWFRTYCGADWRAAVCGHSPPPALCWQEIGPDGKFTPLQTC